MRDQGKHALCCTSMAVVSCMEILSEQNGNYTELSPLYNYYDSRNGGPLDTQLTIYDAIDSATSIGVSPMEFHYTPNPVTGAAARAVPSEESHIAAEQFKIYSNMLHPMRPEYGYADLPNSEPDHLEQWRDALEQSFPIVLGILLSAAYDDLSAENDVYRPEPGSLEFDNGHAVAVVGMDDDLHAFRILDSRGRRFARSGYWWLPYEVAFGGSVLESVAITRLTF